MSARTAHKKSFARRTAPEVTVQPRAYEEEISIDPDDVYASMAPEDLGEYALRAATQSGYPPADSDAHGIGAISITDAPLRAEAYEDVSDEDLLAETLELAEEYGAWVELRGGNAFEWEACLSRDVNLQRAQVVEASLFDPGSEETMYETRRPRVFADDISAEHTQIIRRGKRPSARAAVR